MSKTTTLRVNQQQLARMAHVSRTTVTRALSNDPRISQEVARRIRRLARKHGYRPNAAARSIATQRNNCIGVVLCDRGLTQANYGRLVAGVEKATRGAGMRLQLSLCDTTQLADDELPPIFEEVGVDGVILLGSVSSKLLEQLEHWMMPVVMLGSQQGLDGVDQVAGAPRQAGYIITRHLTALGHRNIGLLIGPRQRHVHEEYALGFESAMREAGVAPDRIASGIQECHSHDVIEPVGAMLERRPDLTAIFADTDVVAWHTIQYLRALGRVVPRDISVVGAGGRTDAPELSISLTSVDVGLDEMAETAVKLLISRITPGEARGSMHVVVQPRVAEGATTAPPPDQQPPSH